MSWKDQGRQQHMWFGHGTTSGAGAKAAIDLTVTSKTLSERSLAITYGVIGALPASRRKQAEVQYSHGIVADLTEAMTAWMRGIGLDQSSFASRFFGRTADDPIVQAMHAAALAGVLARNHGEMHDASENLARAIELIGIDRWSRFVAEAQARASDPATVAAVDRSRKSVESHNDAIRPVYPLETAIGIGAAGVAGGVGAAARAVGGIILKQVLPEKGQPAGNVVTSTIRQEATAEKHTGIVEAASKPNKPARPLFPANPDDLLAHGWKETSHPEAAMSGRRTFFDPQTGQSIEFDKGKPGAPGWRGEDHYHVRNPNSTGKIDFYLDKDGRPIADGNKNSHIRPEQ